MLQRLTIGTNESADGVHPRNSPDADSTRQRRYSCRRKCSLELLLLVGGKRQLWCVACVQWPESARGDFSGAQSGVDVSE